MKYLKFAGMWALLGALVLAGAAELKPQKGFAIGRVTLEGGKPILAEVEEYQIGIQGVSEAGQRVQYSPAVKNGAYRQKLAPGSYTFPTARIKVAFDGKVLTFPLTPVGKAWNKSQESDEGIVQDFEWRVTGQRDTRGAKPNPNNATHWYGLSVGLQAQGWRNDLKQAPPRLPEGASLVFTFTPTSKSIDGRELKPITMAREWQPNAVTPVDDLNDLPPANYDLSGTVKLPDGSTKPLLLQGKGNYPGYVSAVKVTVSMDPITGSLWKQLVGFVME